jgi:disulfide oxidoreductase YuzD
MNNREIKRGEFNQYYPISELKLASVNRDIFQQHAENFKNKLNDFGWMLPIVITNKGNVIEGHHRIESARLLKQKTIPAYIVDWVDATNDREHLNYIININNGNKAWNTLDYLKTFAKHKEDYKIAFNAFEKNSNNITVGNLAHIYFGYAVPKVFKNGDCIIKDLDFAEYLLSKITSLVKRHGKKKIAAYCVREFTKLAYRKTNMDRNAMEYLFDIYDDMATNNHLSLTSISDFKTHMERQYNTFKRLSRANA